MNPTIPQTIGLTEDQGKALLEFLQDYAGSGELAITVQGDGTAVFAFDLVTWHVDAAGDWEEM